MQRNVCAARVSTVAFYWYRLTAVIVRFYSHVISGALVRRGVLPRRSPASVGMVTRYNAVGLTSILDQRQFFSF